MQVVTATPECQQKRLTDARVESARSSPCCEADESFRSSFTSSDSADTCALPTETAEQHVARRAREARINGMKFDTFVGCSARCGWIVTTSLSYAYHRRTCRDPCSAPRPST